MANFVSNARRIYLTVYNWTVFVGWFQVLYLAVKTLRESDYERVYNAVERPLQLAQTAAVLETALRETPAISDEISLSPFSKGLVRSPITATLPQIGSRLFLTWGILWSFPETQTHILVSSLVISWSITEIIRYSFFGLKEMLAFAPPWLLWLRYSAFLLLYPTGITSEVGLIYTALPYIMGHYEKRGDLIRFDLFFYYHSLELSQGLDSEKYCTRLPNKWNFSFDYFSAAILALGIYIPGSPHLYRYMLGQRKKALSKSKKE